ncbi:hypothetical protein U1Q18_001308 [Sarracenia purpurea var. burkii]
MRRITPFFMARIRHNQRLLSSYASVLPDLGCLMGENRYLPSVVFSAQIWVIWEKNRSRDSEAAAAVKTVAIHNHMSSDQILHVRLICAQKVTIRDPKICVPTEKRERDRCTQLLLLTGVSRLVPLAMHPAIIARTCEPSSAEGINFRVFLVLQSQSMLL